MQEEAGIENEWKDALIVYVSVCLCVYLLKSCLERKYLAAK